MSVIEAEALTHVYKSSNIKALDKITLKCKKGICTSILGPNGAGKTTFIKICTTQLKQSEGVVRVLGFDTIKEAKRVRESVSVVPQESLPFFALTTWENIYYYARLRGMPSSEAKETAKKLLKDFGLLHCSKLPADWLSGGLKKRLLITMAFIANPELMFLDEPTEALDPVSRRKTWKIIRNYIHQDRSKSILLATHHLDEAETLSDELVIIRKGKLLFSGTVLEALKLTPYKNKVMVENLDPTLLASLGSYEIETLGNKAYVYTSSEEEAVEVARNIFKFGNSASIAKVTLEDAYIKLVEEHGD